MKKLLYTLAVIVVIIFGVIRLLQPGTAPPAGDQRIEQAFEQQQSDVLVESEGTVIRILQDDNEGSRHQRFIVELTTGQTLLIAHNIDLAPRINTLQEGDRVRFKGEYEWNPQGGVVHWTHHDPDGRHPGGWLQHEGALYQ